MTKLKFGHFLLLINLIIFSWSNFNNVKLIQVEYFN